MPLDALPRAAAGSAAPMPEVSIVGPGAVGLALADALSRGGVACEVVARPARAAELQQRGLWSKRIGVSVQPVKVPIVSQPSADARIILLATKTFSLPQAIEQYCKGRGSDTAVVAFQNGLSADATLRRLAPQVDTFGAVVTFTATSLRPGEVELHEEALAKPTIALGSEDAQKNEALRESHVFKTLERGLEVARVSSLEGARWTKLIVNLNNALFAATGQPARRVYAHRFGPWLAVSAMREGLSVAKASQVKLATIPSASPFLLKLLAGLPDGPAVALFRRQADKVLADGMETLGSTLQSIKRGEPTEIDELNGAIVRLAKPLGIATPLNEALTNAVNAQGRGAPVSTVDQLCDAATKNRVA